MAEIPIYNSAKEGLINSLSQLQRLKEEGLCVDSICEEMWGRIKDLIEMEDKEKLVECREELKKLCTSGK